MAKTATFTVRFTIEEVVTCDVEAEVEVPLGIADDEDELQSWLQENDDAWVDEIQPSTQQIEERSVIEIGGIHRHES